MSRGPNPRVKIVHYNLKSTPGMLHEALFPDEDLKSEIFIARRDSNPRLLLGREMLSKAEMTQ